MTVQVAQDDPELVAERFALSRERRTRRKSAMKEHDGLAGAGDLVLEHGAVVKGALTRIVYTNPAGRSTLEIFRNHRGALDGAGAERSSIPARRMRAGRATRAAGGARPMASSRPATAIRATSPPASPAGRPRLTWR